jgi:hypothetical protein
MRTHIALYAFAALVSLAIVGPSDAQTSERSYETSMLPVMESAEPSGAFSGPAYPRSGAAQSLPDRTRSATIRLSEIATWLSANFDLPAMQDQPRVEFASPMKLASMRYHGILPDQWREDSIGGATMKAAQAREVVAVYHDATRTIFLSDGWTGASPAELSVLVHEMVHHLQNLAGLRYECPAAREKLAYLAQDQWLKLHGLDLETEFELDKFTIVVSSACLR